MASSEVRVSTTEISREILDLVNIKDVTQEYRSAYIINGWLADTGNAARATIHDKVNLYQSNVLSISIADVTGTAEQYEEVPHSQIIILLLLNGVLVDGYCSISDGRDLSVYVKIESPIVT